MEPHTETLANALRPATCLQHESWELNVPSSALTQYTCSPAGKSIHRFAIHLSHYWRWFITATLPAVAFSHQSWACTYFMPFWRSWQDTCPSLGTRPMLKTFPNDKSVLGFPPVRWRGNPPWCKRNPPKALRAVLPNWILPRFLPCCKGCCSSTWNHPSPGLCPSLTGGGCASGTLCGSSPRNRDSDFISAVKKDVQHLIASTQLGDLTDCCLGFWVNCSTSGRKECRQLFATCQWALKKIQIWKNCAKGVDFD